MKKLFYLIIVALLGLASCSMNSDPPDGILKPWDPSYVHKPTYTVASAYDLHGEQTGLKLNINLDTVTPPLNPLHPIPTSLQDYPAFYGYLDCARFMNDTRGASPANAREPSVSIIILIHSICGIVIGVFIPISGPITETPTAHRVIISWNVMNLRMLSKIVLP